jgi:uncharacterized glyoxalase superfamily protein PhnB
MPRDEVVPRRCHLDVRFWVCCDAAAPSVFAALADGGTVTTPLGKTFFASSFGMVNDRFGVAWISMVQGQ